MATQASPQPSHFNHDRTAGHLSTNGACTQRSQELARVARGKSMRRHSSLLAVLASATVLLSLAAFAGTATGEPASGVTPTLLARGTYDGFEITSDEHGPIDFRAEAKAPVDVVCECTNTSRSPRRGGTTSRADHHHRHVGNAHVLRI
jgi:hypothetical protein